jgi:Flp pilus assembly protein TadD
LARQEKTEEALTFFESALAYKPNELSILTKIVKASKTLKRPDKTAHYSRMILSASPQDPAAHATLAQALARMGRIDEARTHAIRAAELEPANAQYEELILKVSATGRDRSGGPGGNNEEMQTLGL